MSEAEIQAEIQAKIQEGIGQAREMKARIEAECRQGPYICSCDQIPCGDIMQIEHERAGEAYNKCQQEKANCEAARQAAIAEIEATKSRVEAECRRNLDKCNCDSITNEQGKKDCELAIIEARYQAQKEKQDKIKENI